MYQRKETPSDASLAELLTIETLRRLERDEPCFVPSVDIPLASQIDPQETDNPGAMAGLLADRADNILQAEYGRGKSAIAAVVKWLVRSWIIIVIFVFVVETGICGHVLLARGADQTVSLEGFGWLLALDLLMAILSVLAMLAPLIGPRRGRSKSVALGIIGQILEDLGKVLAVPYWVFRGVSGLIQERVLQRASPDAHPTRGIERFEEVIGALVGGQSHFLLKAAAATSHLLWTLALMLAFACFFTWTIFREYDFRWHSTWLDQAGQLWSLKVLAKPISWLPLTPVPDEQLVAYLNSDALKASTESMQALLDARIMDLARITEESEGRVRANSDKVWSTDLRDKGIERLRPQGIQAAKEYLHRLDSLIAAIQDDPSAVQLIGHQGQEILYDLDKQLRELKATAEERRTTAEELSRGRNGRRSDQVASTRRSRL